MLVAPLIPPSLTRRTRPRQACTVPRDSACGLWQLLHAESLDGMSASCDPTTYQRTRQIHDGCLFHCKSHLTVIPTGTESITRENAGSTFWRLGAPGIAARMMFLGSADFSPPCSTLWNEYNCKEAPQHWFEDVDEVTAWNENPTALQEAQHWCLLSPALQ